MLKFFFWTLLLANAGLFAYHQGYLDQWVSERREPARVRQQVNADKLKVLPSGAASAAVPGAAAAASSAPAASSASAGMAASAVALADKKPESPACVEIGNFTEADAKRFETQFAPLALGQHLSRRTVQETASHLVFIPSQGSKDLAEKKTGELERLGVTDFFVIADEPNLRWAISLGIFRSADAAKARLVELNKQGVRSARIGLRNASNKVAFQLRDLDGAGRESVAKIRVGFSQIEERACGAGNGASATGSTATGGSTTSSTASGTKAPANAAGANPVPASATPGNTAFN